MAVSPQLTQGRPGRRRHTVHTAAQRRQRQHIPASARQSNKHSLQGWHPDNAALRHCLTVNSALKTRQSTQLSGFTPSKHAPVTLHCSDTPCKARGWIRRIQGQIQPKNRLRTNQFLKKPSQPSRVCTGTHAAMASVCWFRVGELRVADNPSLLAASGVPTADIDAHSAAGRAGPAPAPTSPPSGGSGGTGSGPAAAGSGAHTCSVSLCAVCLCAVLRCCCVECVCVRVCGAACVYCRLHLGVPVRFSPFSVI